MKKITALYAVTAIAVLSVAGQAFARGGSMGGTLGRSGMTPQMTTARPAGGVGSMQPGSIPDAMTGAAAKGMAVSGTSHAAKHQPVMPVTSDKPASGQ